MKTHLTMLNLLLATLSFCQGEWGGYYEGTLLGIQASLSGKQSGDKWTASLEVPGYALTLNGMIGGKLCSGMMTDPQTNDSTPFKASKSGDQITISIRDINPISGMEEDMDFVFQKTNNSVAPVLSTPSLPDVDVAKLNPSLVGLWRYTDTYVSGDFSFATDYFMEFHANGRVFISDGRTAGGGPTSSIDSGSGDVHEGVWKTEKNRLWLNDGTSGWVDYAKFYTEGNSLMLTYNNGKNQVWEKL